MTLLPFVDRPPSAGEVERIRLILSTYQDGTGMLKHGAWTLPGFRDFERTVAAALGGEAPENKSIFDVVLSGEAGNVRPRYGISCKMRRELNTVDRHGRVTIEVTNAAGAFGRAVESAGITKETIGSGADRAGHAVGTVVTGWHQAVSHTSGGSIDLSKSCYLVLLWNLKLEYQLFQFGLDLWDASRLTWSVPASARRLCGHDGDRNLIEWYFASGGQLKLYPRADTAIWRSERFRLEPLPAGIAPMATKAATYFPEKWAAAAAQS